MRQGPEYSQWVDLSDNGGFHIRIPLELGEDFEGCSHVTFKDNRDGTYTITPHKRLTIHVQDET